MIFFTNYKYRNVRNLELLLRQKKHSNSTEPDIPETESGLTLNIDHQQNSDEDNLGRRIPVYDDPDDDESKVENEIISMVMKGQDDDKRKGQKVSFTVESGQRSFTVTSVDKDDDQESLEMEPELRLEIL